VWHVVSLHASLAAGVRQVRRVRRVRQGARVQPVHCRTPHPDTCRARCTRRTLSHPSHRRVEYAGLRALGPLPRSLQCAFSLLER
jgi:hypothetical protein